MTIKAILRDGVIQPDEPLPPDWGDGQELIVEGPKNGRAEAEVARWAEELDEAAAGIPREEHDRFPWALDEIERESKEAVRREWSRP